VEVLVEVEVPAALDGQRVDRVVAFVTGWSRAEVAALVEDGRVQLDGEDVAGKTRVREGQVVTVEGGPDRHEERPAPDAAVEFLVVHDDPDLVVVDKPAGLVVHPGAGVPGGTLVNGLLARYPEIGDVGDPARPGIVHRLDKGTSGLMLVARSPAAYDRLVAALGAREVDRRYLAIVHGVPATARGTVDAPIGRSRRQPTRMAVATGGRDARTSYEVRERFEQPVPAALVECRLETGRTHQIRVHLAAIGHPVVGDDTYGPRGAAPPAPRPMLHAYRLGVRHPITGQPLTFASPIPDDMEAVLDGLR
jgi:23S rRNA pseudouridine1911/1915/1917 synthase